MNERHAFEYVTVRVVPRVERGEFINAGVIVYSQKPSYLGARAEVDPGRLMALDPGADAEEIAAAVDAYVAPCSVEVEDPTVPASPGERFRWLAAPRSTVVQPGPVHAGVADDPAAELERIFSRLVR